MANVTLSVTTPDDGVQPRQSYDLHIKVTASSGMDKNIFVFQSRVKPALRTGESSDIFTSVADPVDLEEMPIGTSLPTDGYPYYRLPEVLLRFRSVELLQETHNMILRDIRGLTDAISKATTTAKTYEVTL